MRLLLVVVAKKLRDNVVPRLAEEGRALEFPGKFILTQMTATIEVGNATAVRLGAPVLELSASLVYIAVTGLAARFFKTLSRQVPVDVVVSILRACLLLNVLHSRIARGNLFWISGLLIDLLPLDSNHDVDKRHLAQENYNHDVLVERVKLSWVVPSAVVYTSNEKNRADHKQEKRPHVPHNLSRFNFNDSLRYGSEPAQSVNQENHGQTLRHQVEHLGNKPECWVAEFVETQGEAQSTQNVYPVARQTDCVQEHFVDRWLALDTSLELKSEAPVPNSQDPVRNVEARKEDAHGPVN